MLFRSDPYTLGLLIAEGAFTKFRKGKYENFKRRAVQFSSSKEDAELYKKVIPYPIKYIGNIGHSWHLYIDDIDQKLESLDLLHKNSYTKHIPKLYLFNDRNIRLELLKGLMDGDGCANPKGASIFITTSEELKNDFMLLCRSLGMNCSCIENESKVYKSAGTEIKAHKSYRVVVYTHEVLFKLPRKIEKQHVYNPLARGSKADSFIKKTAIVSIEYNHEEKGKCVTVDSDDGLYLIGDYVVTHNCNKKGLFAHFSRMNSTYLLTDVLEILVDKQMTKPGGVGNTSKGTNATNPVNGWARQLINKYLLTPQKTVIIENGEEKEITTTNLYLIKNKALLIELSQWNPYKNFDRVSAMGMLMLLREDKLRLMGGHYQGIESDFEDPDDISNDDYWKNNFQDNGEDSMKELFDKDNWGKKDNKKIISLWS